MIRKVVSVAENKFLMTKTFFSSEKKVKITENIFLLRMEHTSDFVEPKEKTRYIITGFFFRLYARSILGLFSVIFGYFVLEWSKVGVRCSYSTDS